MEILKNYFTSSEFVSTACSLLFWIVIFVIVFLISKIKNSTLKKMASLLPEAMIYAESNGTSPEEKLTLCINYIKDRVKFVTKKTIKVFIEGGIVISKNVNKNLEEEEMKSSVTETPVTTVVRELNLTLNETEVEHLKSIMENSGRAAEAKEVYNTLVDFTKNVK